MLQEFMGLRRIHSFIDETEAHLVAKLGVPICIPNCGKCCEENCVTIYSIEASLILSYVIGDGKLKIIDWCRGWLLEKHTGVTIYTGIPYGVIGEQLKSEWNALVRTPCPMLTSDKRCNIHTMRPLVCRAYGVTRDAGVGCPRPIGKGESVNSRAYMGGAASDYLEDEVNKYFGKMRAEHPDYTKVGFLPTMIFRQAREQEFRELIAENKISSAKLIGTDVATQLLWAKQLGSATNILQA
jgi:Fe-S-cluster containining protein